MTEQANLDICPKCSMPLNATDDCCPRCGNDDIKEK